MLARSSASSALGPWDSACGSLGYGLAAKSAQVRQRGASVGPKAAPVAAMPDPSATVEIIRGDKRAHEIVRQEQ